MQLPKYAKPVRFVENKPLSLSRLIYPAVTLCYWKWTTILGWVKILEKYTKTSVLPVDYSFFVNCVHLLCTLCSFSDFILTICSVFICIPRVTLIVKLVVSTHSKMLVCISTINKFKFEKKNGGVGRC